ncbi:hypothetical protein FNV43_RR21979 [Rhamnella rubrinervis]|uniref:Uncharacterized protein n=1 Tax=Rhamnella rubrinervis TaxID=2594499 RepID=A0A8K0GMQ6_9ROSA|nr:hypothetical protein FNV43_RR21979 [Rhamnella rubrinervis]
MRRIFSSTSWMGYNWASQELQRREYKTSPLKLGLCESSKMIMTTVRNGLGRIIRGNLHKTDEVKQEPINEECPKRNASTPCLTEGSIRFLQPQRICKIDFYFLSMTLILLGMEFFSNSMPFLFLQRDVHHGGSVHDSNHVEDQHQTTPPFNSEGVFQTHEANTDIKVFEEVKTPYRPKPKELPPNGEVDLKASSGTNTMVTNDRRKVESHQVGNVHGA